ncbi:MAG: M12 family metallo-peptidase [Rhodothermales bacterium]
MLPNPFLRSRYVLFFSLVMTLGWSHGALAQSLWSASSAKTDTCTYDRGRGETTQACLVVNRSMISALPDAPDSSVEIELDNGVHEVTLRSAKRNAAGTITVAGHIEGEAFPTFHLAVHDGVAAGSFTVEGVLYEVRPTPDGVSALVRVDKERRRDKHSDAVIPPRMPILPKYDQRAGKGGVAAQIDLLMLWDDGVLDANGAAGLAALEASFVDYLNQAASNGGNPDIMFNVVHSEVITYDENQFADMGDDLGALQERGDGVLDEAHTLRELHGADLVHLLLPSFKDDTCGIAYQAFTGVDLAFGITGVDGCDIETFAHEIGHNMGMGHDVYVSDEPEDAFQLWSYGYVDLSNAIHTIMAYSNQCFDNAINCDVVPFFSDPNAQSNGVPLGIADAPPAKAANNFRVLEEAAENRAGFSDLLDACAIALFGAEASASSYMQGEEVQLAFQLNNQNGHSGCTSDVSIAAYLIGDNLDTYLVGRTAVSLTETVAFHTVSGTMSTATPPVGSYGVLLFEDGVAGYYDITAAIGLSVEITAGSGVNTEENALPEGFRLTSAYPNPFNPQATISFEVADTRPVSVRVYDSLGRERAVLADQHVFTAGAHSLTFEAADLPSGTYLVRMSVDAFSDVLAVTLFK